jgi:uncharacterized membrane protein HdeD (DUF308 family)
MQNWVRWLLMGILSAVFGLLALGNAVAASIAVTLVTGVLFVIAGAGQIWIGVGEAGTGHKIFAVLLGVLMVVLGISFIKNPLEGTISLALLVTILIAAGGAIRLMLSLAMRQTPFFWSMLLSGALSVLLAGYILANFAAVSVALLGILLGIELLFSGAGLITFALFLRSRQG